jgi:hypothetical protein
VVTRDVPPGVVVAGNPALVVKVLENKQWKMENEQLLMWPCCTKMDALADHGVGAKRHWEFSGGEGVRRSQSRGKSEER